MVQTEFTYINFKLIGTSKSGRTNIYECFNKENHTLLGKVSYYYGWNKYVFEPNKELKLIFENRCLKDIALFLELITTDQRKNRFK